jgi:hypothetical protein
MISEDDEEGWAGTAAIFCDHVRPAFAASPRQRGGYRCSTWTHVQAIDNSSSKRALLIQLERADGHDPPQQISPFITALDDRFKLC